MRIYLLFFLILYFAPNSIAAQKVIRYKIIDFGAIPNDGKDDSGAFERILKIIKEKNTNCIIELPDGVLNIDRRVVVTGLTGLILFKSKNRTRLLIKSEGFAHLAADRFEIGEGNRWVLNRGDSILILRDQIKDLRKGDLIHVQSSSNFETGWGYKENDVHRIAAVGKTNILLESKFIFNYDSNKEVVNVHGYRFCKLSFANIDFELQRDVVKDNIHSILTVVGVTLDVRNVSMIYSGKINSQYYYGFNILASEKLEFNNVFFKSLQYAVLMNYCRNIYANNTEAVMVRHAYTPVACEKVFIENIKGFECTSVIDAHQSFNVHYKNVFDTLAHEYPNCRAAGTFIENARFYLKDTAYYQDYCYWSIQSFTNEYSFLYSEYDTRFKNVHWVVAKPSGLNGLTSAMCRNLIVENCTTHNVAYYGNQQLVNSIRISQSRIGVIRIDAQKTEVINTVLDGDLYPGAPYVFRFTGSGNTILDDVIVKNYKQDITFLFGDFYNDANSNSLSLKKVNVEKPLKGWTNKFIYPGFLYNAVNLDSESKIKLTVLSEEMKPIHKRIQTGK